MVKKKQRITQVLLCVTVKVCGQAGPYLKPMSRRPFVCSWLDHHHQPTDLKFHPRVVTEHHSLQSVRDCREQWVCCLIRKRTRPFSFHKNFSFRLRGTLDIIILLLFNFSSLPFNLLVLLRSISNSSGISHSQSLLKS